MPLGDLGLTVLFGVTVGLIGCITEALLIRPPSQLLTARLYIRIGRSPFGAMWRQYWNSRSEFPRREQLLMSFMVFFIVGIFCAVAYFVLRDTNGA